MYDMYTSRNSGSFYTNNYNGIFYMDQRSAIMTQKDNYNRIVLIISYTCTSTHSYLFEYHATSFTHIQSTHLIHT